MTILRYILLVCCLAVWASAQQTTYYMQGLLRQPTADRARTYLGITGGFLPPDAPGALTNNGLGAVGWLALSSLGGEWTAFSTNALTQKLQSNAILGNIAAGAALTNLNGAQPTNANLTDWALYSTNALTGKLQSNSVLGNLAAGAALTNLNGAQPTNANLTDWALYSTNALTGKLQSNAFLGSWSSIDTNWVSIEAAARAKDATNTLVGTNHPGTAHIGTLLITNTPDAGPDFAVTGTWLTNAMSSVSPLALTYYFTATSAVPAGYTNMVRSTVALGPKRTNTVDGVAVLDYPFAYYSIDPAGVSTISEGNYIVSWVGYVSGPAGAASLAPELYIKSGATETEVITGSPVALSTTPGTRYTVVMNLSSNVTLNVTNHFVVKFKVMSKFGTANVHMEVEGLTASSIHVPVSSASFVLASDLSVVRTNKVTAAGTGIAIHQDGAGGVAISNTLSGGGFIEMAGGVGTNISLWGTNCNFLADSNYFSTSPYIGDLVGAGDRVVVAEPDGRLNFAGEISTYATDIEAAAILQSATNYASATANNVSNWVNAVSNRLDSFSAANSNQANAFSVANSNLSYSIGTDSTNYAAATANNVSNWVNSVSNLAGTFSTANSNLSYSIGTDATNYAAATANNVSNWVNAVSNRLDAFSTANSNQATAVLQASTNYAAATANNVSNWVDAVSNRLDSFSTANSNQATAILQSATNYAASTANNVSNWVNAVSNRLDAFSTANSNQATAVMQASTNFTIAATNSASVTNWINSRQVASEVLTNLVSSGVTFPANGIVSNIAQTLYALGSFSVLGANSNQVVYSGTTNVVDALLSTNVTFTNYAGVAAGIFGSYTMFLKVTNAAGNVGVNWGTLGAPGYGVRLFTNAYAPMWTTFTNTLTYCVTWVFRGTNGHVRVSLEE